MSFNELLDVLLSNDNTARRNAEASFDSLKKSQPEQAASLLINALTTSENVAHRSLVAVMTRRLVDSTTGIWHDLSIAAQNGVKAAVLRAFEVEKDKLTRRKISHLIASILSTTSNDDKLEWPEALTAVTALCESSNPEDRELGLFSISSIIEVCDASLLVAASSVWIKFFKTLLVDPSFDVCVAALIASCALISSLTLEQSSSLQESVPAMMNVLEKSLTTVSDEMQAQKILTALISLVSNEPKFLRPYLEPACTAMLHIVNHERFENGTRKLGLEFLEGLAENAGSTVRKYPALIEHIMSLCVRFLCATDLDDDEDWLAQDDDPNSFIGDEAEDFNGELVEAGCTTLDRLAVAVGGKLIVPLFQSHWARLSVSGDWRERRAALLFLALISEGCHKQLEPMLQQLVGAVIPLANDPHPRVRHMTLRCLGELCLEFSETSKGGDEGMGQVADAIFQSQMAEKRSTGLSARARAARAARPIAAICGSQLCTLFTSFIAKADEAPRTRGLAAVAMVNLLDNANSDSDLDMAAAAPRLLEALFAALGSLPAHFHSARTNCILALSCSAHALEHDFLPYYSRVISALSQAVAAPLPADAPGGAEGLAGHRRFRARALECLATVCEAVGKEVSGVDAAQCLNFILKSQTASGADNSTVDESGEVFQTTSSALVKLAATLGADFAPYYPIVLGLFFRKARCEIKFEVTDAEEGDAAAAEAADSNENGVDNENDNKSKIQEFVHGGRKVALDSVALEDKVRALECLTMFAISLGCDVPSFWPLLDDVLSVFLENLPGPFPNVRKAAATGLSAILSAALCDYEAPQRGQTLLDRIVPLLALRCTQERSIEVSYALGEALCDCLRAAWETHAKDFGGPAYGEEEQQVHFERFAKKLGVPATLQSLRDHFPKCRITQENAVAVFRAALYLHAQLEHRRQSISAHVEENDEADDEDREQLQQALEEENSLMSNVTDSVGYCIRMLGQAVMPLLSEKPYYSTLMPLPGFPHTENSDDSDTITLGSYLLSWLDKDADAHAAARGAALCFVVDLLEYASPAAHILFPVAFPSIQSCIHHRNPLLRQPAIYGIGVAAVQAPALLAPHVPTLLQQLQAVLSSPEAQDDDYVFAAENAVSAIIKICMYLGEFVPEGSAGVARLMGACVAALPLKNDAIEARLVHGYLVDALLESSPLWVSVGMPALLKALARVLQLHLKSVGDREKVKDVEDDDEEEEEADWVDEDTLVKVKELANRIANSPNKAAVMGLIDSFTKGQKKAMAEFGFK